MARNLVVLGASCVTGIDLHITLAPVSAEKPLQLGPRWRGKGRPGGVIGLEGGEPHHNGTHWRELLIWRKDRVPNRSVRTIRRLCAASLVGSTLVGSWRLEQNLPASTGRFVDGCDTSESNWASYPLYRPRDNLAMLRGGLAKLMRMSMRNMW